MLKGAISRRYADAIFQLALKQNTVDRTLEDVKNIAQVFANRKLSYLLREPKILAKRKEKALRTALKDKVLPTSLNLALLVVQRGLVEAMSTMARELEKLVLDYHHQVIVKVTTTIPLDQVQSEMIKSALERSTGKLVLMQTHSDPSILGGVIARVGDQLIDNSVRYRLQALQRELLAGTTFITVDEMTTQGTLLTVAQTI